MCAPTLKYVEGQVQAESTARVRVIGGWGVCYGATALVTSVGLEALETNCGALATWRTANVRTDSPNAWQAPYPATPAAAYATSGTVNAHTFDITTAATTAMFAQAAVSPVLTTGTTPKEGFVKLWSSLNTKGFIVARQRIEIDPGLGTDTLIVPIGRPFGCAGVTGLMFAMSFYGVSGTITPTPGWRSYDSGDPQRPNGWNALTALANVTGNIQVNSGHNAITTTDKVMAQAGLQLATSGTNPKGIIEVIVAAREA